MDQTRALLEMYADRGPAWRAAIEAGHDMSLVEQAMHRTFEQRIKDLQRAIDSLAALREAVIERAAAERRTPDATH